MSVRHFLSSLLLRRSPNAPLFSTEADDGDPLLDNSERQVDVNGEIDSGDGLNARVIEDRYNVVYWIFFLQGAAMLLPWNAFITASEFFALKFTGSPYADNFHNYFSTCFQVSNLVFFTVALWRQKQANLHLRVSLPLVTNLIVFSIITSTTGEVGTSPTSYFYAIMVFLVFTGASTAYFMIGVFAVASLFPGVYTQAVMSGQGLAGTAVAVASILSTLASTSNSPDAPSEPPSSSVERSAFLYFISAVLVTLASLIAQWFLVRRAFYMHHIERVTIVEEDGTSDEIQEEGARPVSILSVLRKVHIPALAVMLVFLITLSVFPSITALVKSVRAHPPTDSLVPEQPIPRVLRDDLFVSLHFLLFNLGDWAGKSLPALPGFMFTNTPALLTASALRVAFVPLFLTCNIVVQNRALPTWIRSDAGFWVVMLLFSLSNGYLGSLCMIAAPSNPRVKGGREKEMVGSVMSYFLTVGLAVGGVGSFLVREWV